MSFGPSERKEKAWDLFMMAVSIEWEGVDLGATYTELASQCFAVVDMFDAVADGEDPPAEAVDKAAVLQAKIKGMCAASEATE